jgi:hypothetical protein
MWFEITPDESNFAYMKSSIFSIQKSIGRNLDLGLLVQILACTLLFCFYCLWYRTPFVADDHRFLFIAESEGFNFWSLGDCISRTPVYGVLFYFLLLAKYHTDSFYFFYILFFAVHSATLYILSKKIISFFTPNNSSSLPKFLVPATILFAFHPNIYELFTMPGATIYVIGGLFMALYLNEKNKILIFLYSFLAFSTYETYIVPVFALSIIPYLFENIDKNKIIEIIKNIGITLSSFLLFLFCRWYLSKITGEYNQIISNEYLNNSLRILRYFTTVYITGQSGAFISMIENIIFISLSAYWIKKEGLKSFFRILIILLIAIFSSIVDIFVSYEGLRVIYGSLIIKYCIFSLILSNLMPQKPISFLITIFALISIYYVNWHNVYKMRKYSYENQKDIEKLTISSYSDIEPAMGMILPPNPIHFHPDDWALENNSTIQYKLFAKLHKLDKNMEIKFSGIDSLHFDIRSFPILYPSRSFYPQEVSKIKRDLSSFTGQSFEVTKGEKGIAIFGPYITLDSGNYELELTLKTKNKPDNQSPATIVVACDFGKTILSSRIIEPNEVNGRYFSAIKTNFKIDKYTPNVEIQVHSNGNLGFFVDYMRFSKF